MFDRSVIVEMREWKQRKDRKPLILRGARQVGKTSAVEIFSREFSRYLCFNLDKEEDKRLFEQKLGIEDLTSALFFAKGIRKDEKDTLLFIDEIQNSPEAVKQLRYFHENKPGIFVIAAGSLLESLIDARISFPVGRVEYMFLKPVTFREYLAALGEDEVLDLLNTFPVPAFAHDRILRLFRTFAFIGGMPEAVRIYADTRDVTALARVYENLLIAYIDDIEKYARNRTSAHTLQHALRSSFVEAGKRIHFAGFGNSNYRSREMGEALRTLERAMLIELLYPTTVLKPPLIPDTKKSPRLHVIDTGLLNYFSGMQKDIFGSGDLDSVYEGRVAEHIAGQELSIPYSSELRKISLWVRQKKESTAEIDYVIPHGPYIIPIEVKSGSTGKLRSLGLFMDGAPHSFAVRIYSGQLRIDHPRTVNGTEYSLLNLPLYLTGDIKRYLDWFIQQS